VVDVGVNMGWYSLLYASIMNDEGRVLAFEPDPGNCHWIKKAIEVNGYECIELFQMALADTPSEGKFYPRAESGWGSILKPRVDSNLFAPPFDVKIETLDNMCERMGIEKIDVLKIDVEGADIAVLKGSLSILKKSPDVKLVMDVDWGEMAMRNSVGKLLQKIGFTLYEIGPEVRKISRIDHNVMEIVAMKGEFEV